MEKLNLTSIYKGFACCAARYAHLLMLFEREVCLLRVGLLSRPDRSPSPGPLALPVLGLAPWLASFFREGRSGWEKTEAIFHTRETLKMPDR